MKKVKLLIIAIIGICSSCSTDDAIIKTQESVNIASRGTGSSTDPDFEDMGPDVTELISYTITYNGEKITEQGKSIIRNEYFSRFYRLVSYTATEFNNKEIWYANDDIINIKPSIGEATGTDGDLDSSRN